MHCCRCPPLPLSVRDDDQRSRCPARPAQVLATTVPRPAAWHPTRHRHHPCSATAVCHGCRAHPAIGARRGVNPRLCIGLPVLLPHERTHKVGGLLSKRSLAAAVFLLGKLRHHDPLFQSPSLTGPACLTTFSPSCAGPRPPLHLGGALRPTGPTPPPLVSRAAGFLCFHHCVSMPAHLTTSY
jgi:hypothetical protein